MIERLLGGKYTISLGTALIFENDNFDIKKWPSLLYVNLRTLYRNYVHSIEKKDYHKLERKKFIQDYLDEVAEVERIVLEVSNGRVKPMFYYPKYEKLDRLMPHVEEKVYNPEDFDDIEVNMWKYVKQHQLMTPFNYVDVKQELPKADVPVLVLTSFVVDLLSASNFPKLLLLESFTGKIKSRQDWYTKLNVNANRVNQVTVPFNKFTIQVFGDKSGALQGADRQIRKIVRDMAINDHWTPITSIDKIKYSISKLKDYKLKELLFSYL